MTDIMMVFACFNQSLHPTVLRQLTVVAQALLAMTGRVTMLGLSRWAGQGGSYRTIQRSSRCKPESLFAICATTFEAAARTQLLSLKVGVIGF